MKEIKMKGVYETIFYEKLDNGFEIYVWEDKKAHSFEGMLNVFYGADGVDFTYKNKKYKVNRGSAHYLEHVMCEGDEPLLSKFNRLGSYSNAHTSTLATVYEFAGTNNLEENVLLLLKAIFEKEFTLEEIEHERTPIIEEMRMRLDNPNVISFFTLNNMLFKKYPNNSDLGGNKDDISNITLEEVKLLYEAFYHPSNMALVLTGNVSFYDVLKTVKNYFKKFTFKEYKRPKLLNYHEGKRVNIRKSTVKTNVKMPEVITAIKLPLSLFKDYDDYMLINIWQLILTSNFDSTSYFKEDLIEKGLLSQLFYSVYKMYDYLIIEIGCRTNYPLEIEKIILDKLKHMDILKDDVERKKKSALAALVLGYENLEDVNAFISNSLIYEGKLIDNEKELLEKIKMKDIKDVFSKFSLKEYSVLTLMPNDL